MQQEAKLRSNAVFAAVSNPDRRKILDLLKARDRPAGELVEALSELPQPAVSRHLKILREAGLVSVVSRAQQRIYSLQPMKLREVDAWLSFYRKFWLGRLDSLQVHLDWKAGRRQGLLGDKK